MNTLPGDAVTNRAAVVCTATGSVIWADEALYDSEGKAYRADSAPAGAVPLIDARTPRPPTVETDVAASTVPVKDRPIYEPEGTLEAPETPSSASTREKGQK